MQLRRLSGRIMYPSAVGRRKRNKLMIHFDVSLRWREEEQGEERTRKGLQSNSLEGEKVFLSSKEMNVYEVSQERRPSWQDVIRDFNGALSLPLFQFSLAFNPQDTLDIMGLSLLVVTQSRNRFKDAFKLHDHSRTVCGAVWMVGKEKVKVMCLSTQARLPRQFAV